MKWAQKQSGFTIVELLIVVVVIAILAAITIVSYNGITGRAKESALKADISNAVKKLETEKLINGTEQYPSSLSGLGLTASSGSVYYYQYVSSDNSYCVQSSNGGQKWYASSSQLTPQSGSCGSDSLVARWPFNGNADDVSGAGLNGVVVGATLATGKNGKANSAYSFPGSAAYITFGNGAAFNQPELTMSAWVKTNAVLTTPQTIIAKEGKYKYRLGPSGTIETLSSNTAGWDFNSSCSYAYAINTWYNIVWTISSSTARAKLYVNGSLRCDVGGPAITSYNANDLMIGSYHTTGTEGFNGVIDDARFYSRALSAAEVKGLYDADAE